MARSDDSLDLWGLASIALAALLWAVAAVVANRLFEEGVDPLHLAEARAVVSLLALAVLPGAWRRRSTGRTRAAPLLLGLAIALVNASYYIAIDRLPVAIALVIQYTGPGLIVAWMSLVQRERPTGDILVGLAASFVGVVLVSGALSQTPTAVDALGLVAAGGAAVFFATYTVLSEHTSRIYGEVGALFRGFAAATIFWVAFQLPRGFPEDLLQARHLPEVLFVGLAGTLAPFLLYILGVGRVRAARASIAATLEPVLAAAIAWVWLDEHLDPLQLVGGATIVVAVASLQVLRTRRRYEPAMDAASH